MERDFEYEYNNIGYDVYQFLEKDGGGIKCMNYELCETILPFWWFDCKRNYLCTNCHMIFGTWDENHTGRGVLEIRDNVECPICFECKRGVSYPNCIHFACISCFRRSYYGDESRKGEPLFPYDEEIEEEYILDSKNSKWEMYPLIEIFNKNWGEWEDKRMEQRDSEENLQRCPMCRR